MQYLTAHGGAGAPLVLVHGLMGRGSTWPRQLPWLTRLGQVYTYDAPWHRGRDVKDSYPISTERFVADLGDAVESLGSPAVMVGHSMGALHSWCLAASRPELVTCARRRGHGTGFPRSHHWSLGTVAARASSRIRYGPKNLRRVRSDRRTVLPRGIRPDRYRLAAARPSEYLDRDRRRVGHPRLLASVVSWCGRPHCCWRRVTRSRPRARCAQWRKPATGLRTCTCPAPVT